MVFVEIGAAILKHILPTMKIQSSIFNLFVSLPKVRKEETAQRTDCVEPFNALEFSGGADIHLHLGSSENKAIIQAEKSVLPEIRTELDGQTLRIIAKEEKPHGAKFTCPFEVHLYTQTLSAFNLRGHANLISDRTIEGKRAEIISEGHVSGNLQLNVEELTTHISGAGNLTLVGTAEKHTLALEGAVKLAAYKLHTEFTDGSLQGPCKAEIFATEAVRLSATGLSKIRVKGNPKSVEKESTLASIDIL